MPVTTNCPGGACQCHILTPETVQRALLGAAGNVLRLYNAGRLTWADREDVNAVADAMSQLYNAAYNATGRHPVG